MNQLVAVVTNIPRPYRRALFEVLKRQLGAESLDLQILYTSDPAKHVRRGAPAAEVADPETESYVRSITFRAGYERVLALPTGLLPALRLHEPSCVVVGGFGADAVMGDRWCRKSKVPYVLWSGAWPGREARIGRLSLTNRRRLVRNAAAFIAYGSAAADYLVSLGAPTDRVFCAWNTVDLEAIASSAREAAARRPELAEKYRLAEGNLLYIGSMVESKGLRELVSAALTMDPPAGGWAIHLVGAGPLREELETTVRAAHMESHFRFHGLRPATDVAEFLGVADGLVLPTKREAWGLVINEAMACGVPVVASPWAGATRDLIDDGVTGYVVEPGDTAALGAIISRLLSGDPGCRAVGQAGARAVRAKASLERSAEGFVSAVKCAMERRPKVLIIGPLPPPAFGVAKATELMLQSAVLAGRLRLVHLDTSDVLGFANMGRLDGRNMQLGMKHVAQLLRLLRKERPDALLLTASQGRFALMRDGLFVLLGRIFGARVATYLRGSGYADMRARQGWVAARVLRSLLMHSSLVIVLGESLVSMAHAVSPDSRVAVVPNGCPPAVPDGQVGLRDESHPVVAYLGRLSRDKGLAEALDAARSIRASVPHLEFVLCGEWDSPAYKAEIMPLVEEYGLSSTVRFPGPVAGELKADVLARAWVLVVPSHSEGQPWVILEAMSAGVPVVATDTGAIAETVDDHATGFVVPVGDSSALAERVSALVQDDSMWRRMSEASVRRYRERFTVERSHGLLADELCGIAREERVPSARGSD